MVKEEAPTTVPAEERPRIFTTGFLHELTESDLITFFSKYGKVTEAVLKVGSDGTRVKGQAYIYFENQEDVDKLKKDKFVMMDDRKILVKMAFDDIELEGDEPYSDIPSEALKCIVCKRKKFYTVESYLNHRKGKQHQAVYSLYRAQCAAVRNLLQAEAKLAADRQFDKDWMKANPDFNHKCKTCSCYIFCKIQKHEASIEHKMVKNFNDVKCCDILFNTERKKYTNHLLSINHLNNVYDKEQKTRLENDEEKLTMKRAIDIFKQCDADLKEMKETYGELDLNAELPPFDPTKPIGLNYIVKKINYHCICCDQKFFPNINLVEPHCRSFNHFTNMQEHILDIEKQQEIRKKNEEKPNKGTSRIPEKRKIEEETEPNKKRSIITTKDLTSKKVVKPGTAAKSEKIKTKASKMKAEVSVGEDADIVEKSEEHEEEEHLQDEEEEQLQDEEEEHVQGEEDEEEHLQDEEEEYYEQAEEEDDNIQDEEEEVYQQEGAEDEEAAEEDEGADEEQAEGEVEEHAEGEDEAQEEFVELDEEVQEAEEQEVQDDDEIVEIPKEEKPAKVIDIDMEDATEVETKEEEEEEEPPVAIVALKRPQIATRGRRGRGRGRTLKR